MLVELSILQDLVIILGFGYLAGLAVEQLKLPRLVGMLLAGIIVGPYAWRKNGKTSLPALDLTDQ